MTREEFLKQAESVKPGLTEEQFIQAVIKDVNMCEYLAAQGQMYPIYDRAQVDESCSSDELEELITDLTDYIDSCVNGMEESIKRKTVVLIGEPSADEIVHKLDCEYHGARYFKRLVSVEPFEFAYLFLQNSTMKQIMKSFEITTEHFIKGFIVDNFIAKNNNVKKRYENRKNAAPVQSHFPYTAEKIINREGFSKTKNNKGNTYKMTREEFLKQAESVKPGLTEEQFIQAVIKDVNMCEYLAAQGQMYPIYDRTHVDENYSPNEAEESLTRHVKYNADFVIELIEHVELEYKRKYGETNVKEIIADLSYFNLRNAVYFMRLKDVELFELVYLHLQNESMKQEITKLKSSGVSMELFIKKAIIDYFIKASKAIKERYENRKNAVPVQDNYPVAVIEETVTSSPEAKMLVDSVVKAVNDEVSTIYDSVMRSCSEGQNITEADKQYFKDVAGMGIINKIKNNVAVTDAEWQGVIERFCNKDNMIKNGDVAEEDWNYFMGILSKNGMMYKLIKTIKVISNYMITEDNTESLVSVNNMEAVAVNNILHNKSMSPADIASHLNRDKIIEFTDEREVAPEELSRILKILFSSVIQEKLKKYKVRNKKTGYMYEELPDFDFNRQEYNYAFKADSMYREKIIIILLNSSRTADKSEVLLINK
ncbi:hypothetical protein [Blautia producta]|uniref:hypothetical protein n=1 Tax=Blautia producta TaxID=33035 RepID=UPI0031B600D2